MIDIAIATSNAGKVSEIQELLGELVHVSLPGNLPEVVEDGTSLKENAFKKACSAASFLGKLALADDSGLFVQVLDGRPGVRSARLSGPDATDERNRAALLNLMKNYSDRRAYFETTICVCRPEQQIGEAKYFVGRCDGVIAEREFGMSGFGYDRIFVPDEGDGRTFGEMTSSEKARISHRARAVENMKLWLVERDQS